MADGLNTFFQSLSGKLGSAIGNPQAGQKPGIPTGGPVRTPFLTPTTLLSSVYISSGTSAYQQRSTTAGVASTSPNLSTNFTTSSGLNRTSFGNPLLVSPATSLPETKRTGQTIQQQPGFTPIEYYRTPTGEFKITPPKNLRSYEDANSESIKAPTEIGDDRMGSFKFKLADYVNIVSSKNDFETSDGGSGNKPWEKSDVMRNRYLDTGYIGTHWDNEDPVYFGFEVIINVNSSPLFNGEVEKFISEVGSGSLGDYTEVATRRDVLKNFQYELEKYFKFDSQMTAVGGRTEQYLGTSSIPLPGENELKRYYVKKISGLDKLVESNTGSERKSFVDYLKDKLTITFYEDTTLNLGRLASLYKILYWSRLRGKSIIPENLLRFDCEIIVSELRDFVKVRKSNNALEVLKSNLSRYRYQVYECQWWFKSMSHPESIDLSSQPTLTDTYDVEMTFKYSTMVYEQYQGLDLKLRNSTVDPFVRSASSVPVSDGFETNREYIRPSILEDNPGDKKLTTNQFYSGEISTVNVGNEVNQTNNTISNLQQQSKVNIYQQLIGPSPISDFQSVNNLTQAAILNAQATNVASVQANITPKTDIYGRAAEQLVENLKDAALREAQRQLNIQFRLLNNSIDNIRNAFGIGRIPAPKNVYFPKQNTGPYGNSQFFFDVRNSLRNFAGDTLTGLIGGG
jgi:hypothetical protein